MFQFPRFPLRPRVGVPRLFIGAGCPIRRSSAELARQLTEAFRSLPAPFIGLQRLGIHRAPLVALTTIPLPSQPAEPAGGAVGIPQVTLYSLVNLRSCSSARPPGQRLLWLRGPGTNPAHKEGRPGS